MATDPVRVRFAPSPTGYLHVGGARTALFCYLIARKTGGAFILRIEDTDRTRFVQDSLDDILDSLRWLGLEWDEGPEIGGAYGPYFQSERLHLYRQYADVLIERGAAYRCYCTQERLTRVRELKQTRGEAPGYDRHCRHLSDEERARYEAEGRPSVVRLAVPLPGETVVSDLIRGDIAFENETLEDIVLLKSDGYPTYHLAMVVDDHLMEISHVLRGDEYIPTSPLHQIMFRALEWEPPVFVHLPMILDPSGEGKLSKRKQAGDGGETLTMIREFRAAGYLPDALFNFLCLLGWAYSGDQEIFSREAAIQHFALEDIRKSPAVFSYDKLEWMNGVYIREMAPEALAEHIAPILRDAGPAGGIEATPAEVAPLVPAVQERIKTLVEAVDYLDFFFREIETPAPEQMIHRKSDLTETHWALGAARERLAAVEWDVNAIEQALRALADELGIKAGPLFMPIRLAVTGKRVAPPLFTTLYHLGRERVLVRIDRALESLGAAIEGEKVEKA